VASKPIPKRRADGSVVFKLPFRLSPGGRLTSETFDSIEDALKFGELVDRVGGQAARDIRTASTLSSVETPTLRTAFEKMLGDIDSARARGTAPEYRRVADRTWMPHLGDHPVDAITRDSVVKWVTAQRAQETQKSARTRARAITAQRQDPEVVVPEPETYSPKSIRNAHSLLSQTLADAMARGYVSTNVARAVPLPSDHEHDEMVFLSEAEFALLLDQIPEHYEPLVLTLFATGLRWGEATALTPGDLDLDAPTPLLRVSRAWKKAERGSTGYLGSPKSRMARRTVSLPRELVPVLRPLTKKDAGALLFTTPAGTQVGQAHFHERVWTPALDRAAHPVMTDGTPDPHAARLTKRPRIHDLRHSHASLMIARGMNLLALQRRLGHESLKTTGDTYGHLMPDALAAGAELAGATLGHALPQVES
jgi:integrase